ncbi:MAG: hypothetical protein RLZZ387_1192 [Chloroflexota bacterium]
MSAALRILSGGVLTTVQDTGRPGAVRYGVPRGGAMDPFALLAANRLLGNPPGAAALEITAGGASFELLRPMVIAVTGADLGATWNGRLLPLWTAAAARRGDQIALQGRPSPWGARAYLALQGGVDVPLVLGSRSTHLSGGFGGLHGRRLRAGDGIGALDTDTEGVEQGGSGSDPVRLAGRFWPADARPLYGPEPTLRFVPGPHLEHLAPGALAALGGAALRVSVTSNRMGYRLEGAHLPHAAAVSLPSLGVIPGAIQVPPGGAPILLMADAQTTGGYPIAGCVIAADLPLAAQLLPGDALRLTPVTEEQALAAYAAYAGWRAAPVEEDGALELLALAGA